MISSFINNFYMYRLIVENKHKLIILFANLIFLSLTILIGEVLPSLKFFSLMPILFYTGFGFATIVGKIYEIKNLIIFFALSLFCGLFVNTLVLFFLGFIPIAIDTGFLVLYILVSAALNILMFLVGNTDSDILGIIQDTKLQMIDLLWLFIIVALFLFLTNMCLEGYFPLWDTFTFWGLEAKHIFETSFFRSGEYLLHAHVYLPFYPLQIAYVYWIYGQVVEQFASLLTLLYLFIGVLIVYGNIFGSTKNRIKKSLLYLLLVFVIFSFYRIQHLPVTLYADILCSVNVLFFFIFLFSKRPRAKYYWLRVFLLISLSSSLYLTKSNYLLFSLYMIFYFVLYDIKFIIKNIREIISSPILYAVPILFVLCLFLIVRYQETLPSGVGLMERILVEVKFSRMIFHNTVDTVNYLLQRIPLLVSYSLVLLGLSFFLGRGFRKSDIYRLFFLIFFVSFPLFLYIIGFLPLFDSSILRYLGMIFLILPIFFLKSLPSLEVQDPLQRSFLQVGLFGLAVLLSLEIMFSTGFNLKFTPHSGSYKDFDGKESFISESYEPLREFYLLSQEARRYLPESSRIMLFYYDKEWNIITDNLPPIFYIRYFLSDYYVVGPHTCLGMGCFENLKAGKPDYILLISYSGYFEGCNSVLEDGYSYVVKYDEDIASKAVGACFIPMNGVVKLERSIGE